MHFPFTQCIWHKTQASGSAEQYRQDDNVNTLVRRTSVLSLVPVNEIEDMCCMRLTTTTMIHQKLPDFPIN